MMIEIIYKFTNVENIETENWQKYFKSKFNK